MIRFSETAKTAIRKLARVEQPALEELNAFIAANLEGLISPDDALRKVTSIKLIPHDEAFELLHALVPFIFNRLSSATDAASEVTEVVKAVGGNVGDERWTRADEKRLKGNLSALLENPRTRLKSKSLRLMTTHANQFDECEVMSDIRPVFSADGELEVEAGVICHTLKISYFDNEQREFFVTMNSKDLKDLKKQIDRSLDKDSVLSKLIKKAGLEHVKVTSGD